MFKGGKQEADSLNKKHKSCVIASSVNTWVNTRLTEVLVNGILESFPFRRCYIIWDLYDCHTEGSVKAFSSFQKH